MVVTIDSKINIDELNVMGPWTEVSRLLRILATVWHALVKDYQTKPVCKICQYEYSGFVLCVSPINL